MHKYMIKDGYVSSPLELKSHMQIKEKLVYYPLFEGLIMGCIPLILPLCAHATPTFHEFWIQ